MLWRRVLLVVAASLLASSDALSSTSTAAGASIAIERRFLRAERTTSVDNVHDEANDDSEDRVPVRPETLEKISTFKSFKRSMTRAAKSLSDQVSPMLPIKTKLKVWASNEKSLDFVRKELKLDDLAGDALKAAPNFKYYDDFVTSQLPVWAKKQLTPNEVKAELGLDDLADAALIANPNFKYYDEFLNAQVLVWGKEKLSVDDVVVRLGLNTLTGAARTEAANYKYFDEFMVNQLRTWLKDNEVTVLDVMAKLHLDKLSAEAVRSHPNYSYYKYFVKSKLKSWAADWVDADTVIARLGLENLAGKTLEMHPNFIFLQKYDTKGVMYQLGGWRDQGRSTYYIWKRLQLSRYKPTRLRQSRQFEVYTNYVNMLDDYIIKLKKAGAKIPPNLISNSEDHVELRLKTHIRTKAKRSEEYMLDSLGLKGLTGDDLKNAPNYKHYEYYLDARVHIK
ncbi:hypothetical protein PR003_g29828 [Phytophthora rubi]|uniref:RxLR effector protein n=1 Tax=Phytophthora rubi TaxID=129364 RepID=A0A6A3GXW8_9STRA|nr:hypothetical protein PR002_g29764 [Phytophthora rubi]KAE9273684.1 hypothetical protein PR003_g29828 [Phytophthora rubi]